MAARCVPETFSTTCAVHIEDCGGWWSSGCHGSVTEYWRFKPEVSWVRLLGAACLFTFLFFCLITSKFIYFQCETRCSEQLTLLFCFSAVLFFHAVCFTDSLSPCTGTGKTTILRRLIALNPNWKFLYCVYNKLVTTHCTGNCYSIVLSHHLSHYCTSNDAYIWIDRPRQKLIVHDNTYFLLHTYQYCWMYYAH